MRSLAHFKSVTSVRANLRSCRRGAQRRARSPPPGKRAHCCAPLHSGTARKSAYAQVGGGSLAVFAARDDRDSLEHRVAAIEQRLDGMDEQQVRESESRDRRQQPGGKRNKSQQAGERRPWQRRPDGTIVRR